MKLLRRDKCWSRKFNLSVNRACLSTTIQVACFCQAGDVQYLAIQIASSICSVLLDCKRNVSHEQGLDVVYSSNVSLSFVGDMCNFITMDLPWLLLVVG